ncbi:hypothetical protein ACFPER_05190 [Agromyces aurantiacus]|uniref:Uncharacterized protein n=1 Tax=Agromyces aurantiacus TaxID=165814 RepID=A0ABV9R2X3_9MICO|nr:hypothetical protein [Agromyces aurantiacus]MBM7502855.1 hypothetical protein [Agromyces aurantiacus]
MIASDPFHPTAGVAADRLLDALDHLLFGLRAFRAEVERVQPGLVLERIDGWHSGAADHYADRTTEVRVAVAGAERFLLDAEAAIAIARERARTAQAAAIAAALATPDGAMSPTGRVW